MHHNLFIELGCSFGLVGRWSRLQLVSGWKWNVLHLPWQSFLSVFIIKYVAPKRKHCVHRQLWGHVETLERISKSRKLKGMFTYMRSKLVCIFQCTRFEKALFRLSPPQSFIVQPNRSLPRSLKIVKQMICFTHAKFRCSHRHHQPSLTPTMGNRLPSPLFNHDQTESVCIL